MALIIPHQSEQGINTARGGQAANYVGASTFMTPGQENLGQGMQQLAAGVNKLTGVLYDAELRKRQEQMELTLIEDMQAFQTESQAWADGYRQQNRGRDAVNAEADARAFYDEKVKSLRQRWAGNERAELYIQRNAGGMALSGVNSMRDYGNRQQEAWKDSVFAGQMATFKDVAADWRSTPDEIQTAYQDFAGKNNAYLMSKGMDPTAAQIQTERVYREAMAARTEQGFIENINSGNIAGARASLEVMKHGDAAGFVAQYESGMMGSKAIGYDSTGGTSYGKFQLSSKAGTFDDWLKWLDKNGHEDVARELRAPGPADTGGRNGKTPEAWRALVQSGAITDDMQLQFIKESHLDPALAALPKEARDAILADGTLYRAFFSTAVQHGHGGAAKLISRNWSKSGGDTEAFLDSLYADRKSRFGGSTDEVRAGAASRFDRERAALGASVVSPDKVGRYEKMLQTATREQIKTDAITQYSRLPPDQAARAALLDPILTKDPQTQRSVVEYFDWQTRQRESAQKQAQLQQLNQSYEAIRNAAGNRDIHRINGVIMGATPEHMPKLQSFANRIVNGDGLISDPVAFDDMVARINEGQPVQIDAEYGHVLSLKDVRRGKDMISRRDLAEYRVQERAAFDEEALRYQPKISVEDRSALFRQFEASIPDGGYKDPAQRQKALAAFWRKITVGKPWSFSKDIRGFQEKEFAAKGYYPGTGAEYQQLVATTKAQIKARDGDEREPTEEELIRLYQQLQGVEGDKK